MKYDIAVVIGRFQPVHYAHKSLIEFASTQAHKVIVVVGSAYQPRTEKNPFTWEERAKMIRGACPDVNMVIAPNKDTVYDNDAWVSRVELIVELNKSPTDSVVLVGHEKDHTSHYLNLFPQWDRVEFDNVENSLNASDIRSSYLRSAYNPMYLTGVVPSTVLEFLDQFSKTAEYSLLIKEKQIIDEYRAQYAAWKFPPTFVTVDAVCVHRRSVLLIERKHSPGKGTLALPGGFLDQHEFIVDGAIRELREETTISCTDAELKGYIKHSAVFDYPNRSSRGRTITHAFLIELPDDIEITVEAADDASSTLWVPLNQIDSSVMFEDHESIINQMVCECTHLN